MTKGKSKLSLEKMLALPFQRMAKLSPDGRKIAFVSNMSGHGELHVLDIKTRMVDQITHGEYGSTFVFDHYWSPDSTSMIFPRDPTSGKEKWNLCRVSIPDGIVTQITDSPENSDVDGKQSPIDDSVAFISDRSGSYQMHLAKLDGTYIGQFTEEVGNVVPILSEWYWSTNGQFTVFTKWAPENPQQYDIWMARTDGSDEKQLVSVACGSQEVINHISKNGSMILFTSDHSGTRRVGIYHLTEDEIRWISDGTSEEEGVCFATDDSNIVVVRHADAENTLVVYDVGSCESTLFKLPSGVASAGKVLIDNRLLLVSHEDSTHRPRYLLYDLDNHTSEEIIEAHYGDFKPDRFHPEEYIAYPSSGGVTIHALLYKPKDVLPEERLPAIVIPHGGPTLHYIRRFREPIQVLVDRGYVCLLPNIRGSTGYGAEFRDACLKDWGGKDLDDIEHAVAYLRGLDFVDL
ncbi:MAG: S9 family peptidase, partial [Promethearchaeota archaeon]